MWVIIWETLLNLNLEEFYSYLSSNAWCILKDFETMNFDVKIQCINIIQETIPGKSGQQTLIQQNESYNHNQTMNREKPYRQSHLKTKPSEPITKLLLLKCIENKQVTNNIQSKFHLNRFSG